jgi:hypothetical protein
MTQVRGFGSAETAAPRPLLMCLLGARPRRALSAQGHCGSRVPLLQLPAELIARAKQHSIRVLFSPLP